MYAVGKLGSYISRGVVTVAAPFHPFGGAVDIVVVEQEDGSFKSSPWHIQFGKFQGVLKAREKVVTLNINGVDADFQMYLDNKGGAYFVREVDVEDGVSETCSSGDDSQGIHESKLVSESEAGTVKAVAQYSSTGPRILGYVFGRRSEKGNGSEQQKEGIIRDTEASLERAEIAADLLEVRWSTSLATRKQKKENGSIDSSPQSHCSNDAGDTVTPIFTSPKACMESFTLEEKHFEVNGGSENSICESVINQSAYRSESIGSNSFVERLEEMKSDAEGVLSSGDEHSTVFQVLQADNGSRIEIIKPSGSFMEEVDSCCNGESELNSEYSTTVLACETDTTSTEKLEDKEPCKSGFVTPDDVETVLQTKVEVILGCKTNEGPLKLVDELVVDHIAPNQAPRLTSSFLIEEATTAALHLMEDLRLKEDCSFSPNRAVLDDLESLGDDKVYGFAEELSEAQDATPLDSPKFDESNEMLTKSQSFTSEFIQDTSPNDDSSCHEFSRTTSSPVAKEVDSFSSSLSNEVENNSQDINHTPTTEELKELLSDPAVEISLCRHLLHEGMGYEAAAHAFDSEQLDVEKLVSVGPDYLKNDKLVVRIGGLYFPWTAALPIISAIGSPRDEEILEPKGMIDVGEVEYTVETSPQHATESSNGTWRLWPFKKAKSMNKRNSVAVLDDNTSDSKTVKKKLVRAKTPTSEQLASLNLKEGKNTVIFTFSTSMLGEQKVDARIYLWKWNDRIVISDVDGTITKSDVLGQFMPMVGYDWSQTGVTHLFSAIKENGYKLLFLSARAISQASVTRQFLFNLKQDGKALPEGPVVISPDGLFPSLFREVIRRAPHEFKIACLEDIKALFPPDTNPFYAGFGNRDTDIISYVKVGIPKGKVYIINPKGEVAVHRCVATKSYASLHELVDEMFPESSAASLSEKEDFNSWNFWRLPPPESLA